MKQELPETGYKYILDYFEDYDYRKPKVPKELLDMRHPKNVVGHQQRAFIIYYCAEMYKRTKGKGIGLDVGAGQAPSPWCKSLDYYAGSEHPNYGGAYWPDIQASGECLPFKDNTFDWLVSNHAIEHMDAKKAFHEWLRVLKPGGIIAFVTPDAKYGPIHDPDGHVKEWEPEEFFMDILLPLIEEGKIRVIEIDSFKNSFSWNLVVKKKI